jgi:hypothetical protein
MKLHEIIETVAQARAEFIRDHMNQGVHGIEAEAKWKIEGGEEITIYQIFEANFIKKEK